MTCIKMSASEQTFVRSNISRIKSMDKRNFMETAGVKDVNKETLIKKLSTGQLVYVRDNAEGWIKGTVVDAFENITTVQTDSGQTLSIHVRDVHLRSADFNFVDCSRLTEVTPINEATVLECLHQRFLKGIFYTSAGTTIVAVNPFRDMPHLYDTDKIQEYHQHGELLSPHIYLIAEDAYTSMVRELGKINQSIIVSGESGAGKTVSAKHLLKYLTVVSSPDTETGWKSSLSGSAVERQVLDSNPILEAFGNAATPLNENSSRFGKFIQLQFHRNGCILGGVIQTYLLEKTRVVHQGVGDNNFHIFYQLLSLRELSSIPFWLEGVKADVERSQLELTIKHEIETVPVLQIVDAMTDIGITPKTQVSIFQVLLAILHLTTLEFISTKDGEASSMSDDEVSNWSKDECSRILGISPLSLHHALLNRNIVSGTRAQRSVFVKPVSVEEARSRRDCLAMLLYARLFDWLVDFINLQIKASQFDRSISLLDIYGFETFNINGLEQLCINYANERLQQHYVSYFLRDLQTEYEIERIPWRCVSYRDNRMCVETLDGPTGVFGVFNEEVHLSRKSKDSGICGRIVAACGTLGAVRKSHAGEHDTTFCIRHYAGEVLYTVTGAVTKNKDNIPQELISLLGTSDNSFVLNLFTDEEFSQTEHSLALTKMKKKKTVLTKFKSSLDSLMATLQQSDTHYIRCIKPNSNSDPGHFDRPFVLRQLQACGTLETVEICRMGYPARMVYRDFIHRYGVFMRLRRPKESLRGPFSLSKSEDNGHCCQEENSQIVETFYQKIQSNLFLHDGHLHRRESRRSGKLNPDHKVSVLDTGRFNQDHKISALIFIAAFSSDDLHDCHLQFGLHKMFLTQKQLEHLEHSRAAIISSLVTRVQASWRCALLRRQFLDMRLAALKLQTTWRAFVARRSLYHMRSSAVKIQAAWRVHRMKLAVKRLLKSSRTIKKFTTMWVRWHKFRSALEKMRQQQKETVEESQKKLGLITPSQCHFQQATLTDNAILDMVDHKNDADNNSESSGHWSDDSGVMIKDYARAASAEPNFEASPPKKQKMSVRSDLRIGNGIITCRRLTKPGYRFHIRLSVLKYAHVVHYSELAHGLPDALPVWPTNEIFNQSLLVNDKT